MAHVFNNLLTIVGFAVEVLELKSRDATRRERYVGATDYAVRRGSKLTLQCLAFACRQTLAPEIFDAITSLADMREMKATLSGTGIRIADGNEGQQLLHKRGLRQTRYSASESGCDCS